MATANRYLVHHLIFPDLGRSGVRDRSETGHYHVRILWNRFGKMLTSLVLQVVNRILHRVPGFSHHRLVEPEIQGPQDSQRGGLCLFRHLLR
jgi:hypothetical protein